MTSSHQDVLAFLDSIQPLCIDKKLMQDRHDAYSKVLYSQLEWFINHSRIDKLESELAESREAYNKIQIEKNIIEELLHDAQTTAKCEMNNTIEIKKKLSLQQQESEAHIFMLRTQSNKSLMKMKSDNACIRDKYYDLCEKHNQT
jgi:hypothetical protein